MAKKQQASPQKLTAKQKKQAEAQAQAEQEKRQENARKNAQLGNAFLFTFMAIVAIFCAYKLIQTLFFRSATVSDLRDDLLFLSLISIPYLILCAAFLVRKLRRKQRAEASAKVRLASGLIYFLVLVGAVALCLVQLFSGRVDASGTEDYQRLVAASQEAGLPVTQPQEVAAFKSLLEYSMETELVCGETKVLVNLHSGSGLVASLFDAQVRQDYSAFSAEGREEGGAAVTVWAPAAGSESPRAALCVRQGSRIVIVELAGPEAELNALLPALERAVIR